MQDNLNRMLGGEESGTETRGYLKIRLRFFGIFSANGSPYLKFHRCAIGIDVVAQIWLESSWGSFLVSKIFYKLGIFLFFHKLKFFTNFRTFTYF